MDIREKKKIEIFCCYAREDQALLREFTKQFKPLERQGRVEVWSDIDIKGGEEWEKEIEKHLNSAQIILLFVSRDFIASDYCYSKEMQRALERHESGEALVIPIILRPAAWKITPLRELQALPTNATPITRWTDQDDAFLDAFNGLQVAIEDLEKRNLKVKVLQVSPANEDNGETHIPDSPPKKNEVGAGIQSDPARVRQIVREATQVVHVPLFPIAQPVVVDLQLSFLPDRLTQLGFQALVLNDGTRLITPPMCDVLPGPFEMGTLKAIDPQAYSDELPAHTVSLKGFRIARFPVTVAEYDCAVRMKRVREPDRWVEQLAVPDQPAVYISWDDAVQYTNWLAEKTSEAWRLPTEAEWEKAAKWDDLTQTCRRYPWGEEWNSDNANTKEHNRRWVSTIGSFPQGASPCGALDMCGNVSEWTHSIYKSYPYNALDGRENERSAGHRVIRGGSWFDSQRDARTTFRVGKSPIERLNTRGFRLALSGLGEVEE